MPRPSACDIALFILWSRIGTPLSDADYPPDSRPEGLERSPTGTEWEFFDVMGQGQKTGQPALTGRCSVLDGEQVRTSTQNPLLSLYSGKQLESALGQS